jgi:hypothetical protein
MALDADIVAPLDPVTATSVAVNTPALDTQAGFVAITFRDDSGQVTGTNTVKDAYASDDYRLAVGRCTPTFDWNFNGAAQATGQWLCAFTTMTMTEGGGTVLCNANSTATTATGCSLQSCRYFKLMGQAEMYGQQNMIVASNQLEAGQLLEFGFFKATTTTLPADGAYFRINTGFTLCIINYNGTETQVQLPAGFFGTGNGGVLQAGILYTCGINVTTTLTEFWISNVLVATIATPSGQGAPFSSLALPWCFQQRNQGAITGAQAQMKVAAVNVVQDDLDMGMPFAQVQAAAGLMGYQGGEGGTPGSTASLPNSAAGSGPAAAVLNNTTANVTGLGGIAAILPTYAVNDDGLLFSYQVPAGGVAQIPRTFMCTGVQIQGCVSVILAGGPVSYFYELAFGHNAVSLATGEGASFSTGTTKAPRKIFIGIDTYPATAAVGTLGSSVPIDLDLSQAPVAVNPGEYIAIVARNIAAVTTTGAITVGATIKGYWI